MAFTGLFPTSAGGGGGSLLGSLAGGNSVGGRPVIGIGSSLLSASFAAQSQQAALRALGPIDRGAAVDLSGLSDGPARLPVVGEDSGQSLNRRVNEIRNNPTFIDLDDSRLDVVENDPDRQATFALQIALDRLQALAELAADRDTTDSTRRQLDTLFRQGLQEVEDFVRTADTNLLSLQYGSRESNTESTITLGRDQNDYSGALVATTGDEVLTDLTGSETFTVSLSNNSSGVSDDITVNLADVSGDLTLNNIVALVNERITSIQATDQLGDPVFDSEGDPVARYQTRFELRSSNGRVGLEIDTTITEDVRLSAAAPEPNLFVASTVDPLDDSFNTRGRVTTFGNLSGTISEGGTISFAATDIEETLLAEETAEVLVPEREVDADIAARRDQFRTDAETAVAEANNTTDDSSTSDTVDELLAEQVGVDGLITDLVDDTRIKADTSPSRVASDSEGNIIVVGTSAGSFGSEINTAETQDVFITKFNNQGDVIFSRLLGASESADAFAVTVDSNDNIIVAGQTESALVDGDLLDTKDAFVAKFNSSGDEQFRFQLDTFGTTEAASLVVDATGDIFLGGSSSGSIGAAGGTFQGVTDNLLLQIDGTTGALEQSALLGTAGRDEIKGLAFADDGDLLIASEEGGNAVVRKVSASDFNTQNAVIDVGFLGTAGSIQGITADSGQVFIAGVTQNGSLTSGGSITQNGVELGGQEGFVTGITVGSNSLTGDFTQIVSTAGTDRIADITASGGQVFVAGTSTGTLTGETSTGGRDGFVTRLNASTGALEDSQQFGVNSASLDVGGVAFTTQGQSVLNALGLPSGSLNQPQSRTLIDQTSVRAGDFFSLEVNGRTTKIEIGETDTFIDIRRQLRVAAFDQLKVTVSDAKVGDGQDIKIETVEGGAVITLIPGTAGRDALERLGIQGGTLIPTDRLFRDLDDPTQANQLGGSFGLGIDLPLNISDITNATFALDELEGAIRNTGRAFRSLRPNPLAALLNNDPLSNVGPPPPAAAARLANLQSGLQRLQAGGAGAGGLSLFA